MNASFRNLHPPIDAQALEARLVRRLVADLDSQAERLPADVQARLCFAREQALTRALEARQARGARTPAAMGVTPSGGLLLGAFALWMQRAALLLPLLLLLGGLVFIQAWSARERVLAAAEIDMLLLADALPPSAYGDPGFAEFLRSPPQP